MPAAAQLACTPVVAAISGQVSLVAVAANLLVAPVVGPATVLGLAGGLVGLVWRAGRAAARHARGLVRGLDRRRRPARRRAAGRRARLGDRRWRGAGPALPARVWSLALVAARGCCTGAVPLAPRCCRGARAVTVRPPTPGWPPDGLGAGGLRRRAGRRPGAARRSGHARVVVDVGPDPRAGRRLPATGSASSRCRSWC